MPASEAHRHNAFSKPAKTIKSFFLRTMPGILGDNALGICERILGELKRNAVLSLVFLILLIIPNKSNHDLVYKIYVINAI